MNIDFALEIYLGIVVPTKYASFEVFLLNDEKWSNNYNHLAIFNKHYSYYARQVKIYRTLVNVNEASKEDIPLSEYGELTMVELSFTNFNLVLTYVKLLNF